ncbi:ribose-phosphate pyrophosphokinase [Streptococcus pneumoniae]|nr:ribose-phosphate pyrophosphokinase [Streptococcus pneumoniae]
MESKLSSKFRFIIRIFFINRLWAYLCSQVNQNLEKIRQREGDTHQSYKQIAPVYAIAIVDSNYFSDDLAFHSSIVK